MDSFYCPSGYEPGDCCNDPTRCETENDLVDRLAKDGVYDRPPLNPDKPDKAPDVAHGASGQAHSSGAFRQEPETTNASVIAWQDRLTAIAAEGIEVSLTYSPSEHWPHEADERPVERRWQAWATTVPGTDMCQYVQYGATPDEAMAKLYAELYP